MRQNNAKVQAGFQSALVFNTRRVKLADVRVREALTMAFDFEWTNRAIYDGFYSRVDSYFAGTELAALHAAEDPGRWRSPRRFATSASTAGRSRMDRAAWQIGRCRGATLRD